jgi:hypothetical protein
MRLRAALPFCLGASLLLGTASPAFAQFGARPYSDPATGETYHVEFAANFWSPSPDIVISSESLGIIGSNIDFVDDLGIEKEQFGELRLVLRPGLKHKFRFHYIPMEYNAEAVLKRSIVFNGIRYDVGLPVKSSTHWKSFRIGYEYDFVYRDRGFAGFILDVKYTDVDVTLDSVIGSEFTEARGPIPTIGGIGRVYVAPNISLTIEITGFRLPESVDEDYRGTYIDFDLYGTVNFTDNVGVQVGFRSLDVEYKVEGDRGDLLLRGPYFGGVVRF